MPKFLGASIIIIVLGFARLVNFTATYAQTDQLQIAYRVNLPNDDICIITLNSRDIECITNTSNFFERNVIWSPQGDKLTYQALPLPIGSGSAITYLYDFDSRIATALVNNFFINDWSPDGEYLLTTIRENANDDNEIVLLSIDNQELIRLTDDMVEVSAPKFSRDGSQITYIGDSNLYALSTDGEQIEQLTNDLILNREVQPIWSPDDAQIAFVVNGDFVGTDQTSEIYVINADGSDPRQITNTGGVNLNPQWSPDGSQLTFYGYEVGAFDDLSSQTTLRTEVFRINADGTDLVNLSQNRGLDYHPSWSPDGDWIAFASTREQSGIFVVRPDGSELQMLTDLPPSQEANYPVWQPITVVGSQ